MDEIAWNGIIWKRVPGYDSYFASKDGRIISTTRGVDKAIIMKPMSARRGHLYVFMYKNRKAKKVWVHRAVLSAWIRPARESEECRHLNDIPYDNRLENLAWGSSKENADDKKRNGHLPIGENSVAHKLTEEQVIEIRNEYATGSSSAELSQKYGVSKNQIIKIANGKNWSHLPVLDRQIVPSCARKTPIPEEHLQKLHEGTRRYIASIRKERKVVLCACGCGTLMESVDSKGRERKFIHGHNQRGRKWRLGNHHE